MMGRIRSLVGAPCRFIRSLGYMDRRHYRRRVSEIAERRWKSKWNRGRRSTDH